jgi:hypothetical protein
MINWLWNCPWGFILFIVFAFSMTNSDGLKLKIYSIQFSILGREIAFLFFIFYFLFLVQGSQTLNVLWIYTVSLTCRMVINQILTHFFSYLSLKVINNFKQYQAIVKLYIAWKRYLNSKNTHSRWESESRKSDSPCYSKENGALPPCTWWTWTFQDYGVSIMLFNSRYLVNIDKFNKCFTSKIIYHLII